MADPRDVLAQRVSAALGAAFGPEYEAADPVIRPSSFADYQSNAALPLAKRLGRPSRDIAADIIRHLDLTGVAEPPEVSGPGFINLRLLPGWIAAEATSELRDPRLGVAPAAPARKVVVDYSGPNVAKELHVGHLRATVVGDALVRVFEHLGHTVIRAAHLGDWGTPFGMLIEHVLDIGEEATRKQLVAGEFTAFYQAARAEFDDQPGLRRAGPGAGSPCCRAATRNRGGSGRCLVAASMEYLTAIYRRLGVTLTEADMAPESFYNPMLADVCAELQERRARGDQ